MRDIQSLGLECISNLASTMMAEKLQNLEKMVP